LLYWAIGSGEAKPRDAHKKFLIIGAPLPYRDNSTTIAIAITIPMKNFYLVLKKGTGILFRGEIFSRPTTTSFGT